MFSSPEGQTELANSAGFERVIITMLGRGHRFVDMDSIKKELSSKVMELAPKSLSSNAQVENSLKSKSILFSEDNSFASSNVLCCKIIAMFTFLENNEKSVLLFPLIQLNYVHGQ